MRSSGTARSPVNGARNSEERPANPPSTAGLNRSAESPVNGAANFGQDSIQYQLHTQPFAAGEKIKNAHKPSPSLRGRGTARARAPACKPAKLSNELRCQKYHLDKWFMSIALLQDRICKSSKPFAIFSKSASTPSEILSRRGAVLDGSLLVSSPSLAVLERGSASCARRSESQQSWWSPACSS